MFAKRFFFICAGLLCLALAYHLGATSATAQAPGNPVVAARAQPDAVVTANGDVYLRGPGGWNDWHLGGNISTGAPTPVQQSTFGAVKATHR